MLRLIAFAAGAPFRTLAELQFSLASGTESGSGFGYETGNKLSEVTSVVKKPPNRPQAGNFLQRPSGYSDGCGMDRTGPDGPG